MNLQIEQEKIIQFFIKDISVLIPNFIKELLYNDDEPTKEHYSLLIFQSIKNHCNLIYDVRSICAWCGIDDDFFKTIKEFDGIFTYKDFIDVFHTKGVSNVILDRIIDKLIDCDVKNIES